MEQAHFTHQCQIANRVLNKIPGTGEMPVLPFFFSITRKKGLAEPLFFLRKLQPRIETYWGKIFSGLSRLVDPHLFTE